MLAASLLVFSARNFVILVTDGAGFACFVAGNFIFVVYFEP